MVVHLKFLSSWSTDASRPLFLCTIVCMQSNLFCNRSNLVCNRSNFLVHRIWWVIGRITVLVVFSLFLIGQISLVIGTVGFVPDWISRIWSVSVKFGQYLSNLVGIGRIWSVSVGFGRYMSGSIEFGRIRSVISGSVEFGRERSDLVPTDPYIIWSREGSVEFCRYLLDLVGICRDWSVSVGFGRYV